jgi:hypothetical protein
MMYLLYMPDSSAPGNLVTKYLSPDYLWSGVQLLCILISIVVLVIYLYLWFKKRNYFYTKRLSRNLDEWIGAIITEESVDSIEIPDRFYRIMSTPTAKQFVIDELLNCKRNFSGSVAENISKLYEKLGLKKESIRKMRSRRWHIRAKGIQELYMMDQKDMLRSIYKYTNSKNEYVRNEAQTGVIHLTGFSGLRFLNVVSYPLTEWQQLQLLERLRLFPDKPDITDRIPAWLKSTNDTVVEFALKLAADYQLFGVKKEVAECMKHQSPSVRSQAVRTTVLFSDESLVPGLMNNILYESYQNQLNILKGIQHLATMQDKKVLLELLQHPNDMIKLRAAVVLARGCFDGLQILQQKAVAQPEPFARILSHVQFELSA